MSLRLLGHLTWNQESFKGPLRPHSVSEFCLKINNMKLKYDCELVSISPHVTHVISFPSLNLVKQMKKQTLRSVTHQNFVQRPCTRATERCACFADFPPKKL